MKAAAAKILRFVQNGRCMLPACYALALVLWLVTGLFCFGYDNAHPPTYLPVEEAGMQALDAQGQGWYLTRDEDPQMVFEGLSTGLRRVVLECEFESPPGEIDLYYCRPGDEGFSASRRVWGRLMEDGNYEFLLPVGQVTALRIDPGSIAGNRVKLLGVQLNQAGALAAYLLPNLRQGLGLATLPALAYCAIYIIIEIFQNKGCKTAANSDKAPGEAGKAI